jgi:hypothetical protein
MRRRGKEPKRHENGKEGKEKLLFFFSSFFFLLSSFFFSLRLCGFA